MASSVVKWLDEAVLIKMFKACGMKKDGDWRVVNNHAHFAPLRASIYKSMSKYSGTFYENYTASHFVGSLIHLGDHQCNILKYKNIFICHFIHASVYVAFKWCCERIKTCTSCVEQGF